MTTKNEKALLGLIAEMAEFLDVTASYLAVLSVDPDNTRVRDKLDMLAKNTHEVRTTLRRLVDEYEKLGEANQRPEGKE